MNVQKTRVSITEEEEEADHSKISGSQVYLCSAVYLNIISVLQVELH